MSKVFGDPDSNQDELAILQGEDEETKDTKVTDDSEDEEEDKESDDEESADEDDDDDSVSDEEEDEEEEKIEDTDEDDDDEHIGGFKHRPTYGEVKTEFPELFKKFPTLKEVFFREKKYTEIFPTIEDAEDAANQLEEFEGAKEVITSGNVKGYLDLLRGDAKKRAIIDFLPTLQRENVAAFQTIVEPIIKNVLRHAYNAGKEHDNADLVASAENIHQVVFGNKDVGKPLPKPEIKSDPERESFEREKEEFLNSKLRDAETEISSFASRFLEKRIQGMLPDNIPPYLRKSIIRDSIQEMGKLLNSDKNHARLMKSMWKRARANGYSKEWTDKVRTTYISRALNTLPVAVKKVKSEALKGIPRKPADTTKRPSGSSSRSTKTSKISEADVKAGRVSELDFLKS